MTGSVVSGVLLVLTIAAISACILAPLTVLGVMFWHWQKELKESMRLRQARTTQIR